MEIYKLHHPLSEQGFDGTDITEVTIKPMTVGIKRKTATEPNAELRELAIMEKLTGLTPGQIDALSIKDYEGLKEVIRPLLPFGLATGLLLADYSLSSALGSLASSTDLPPATLPGGAKPSNKPSS